MQYRVCTRRSIEVMITIFRHIRVIFRSSLNEYKIDSIMEFANVMTPAVTLQYTCILLMSAVTEAVMHVCCPCDTKSHVTIVQFCIKFELYINQILSIIVM